ncbi:lipid IV(A) 3-deoxy-D-manno-octulosonic acid transferase [Pseudidiomarina mangrovi]|uniref:lipid IV(A) 3-deoxy-D-manno-octulosonic acid transferase n=1 Tax=Pseudidiomarina mangrovi TaxID=2487133 RepID=UPI000FCA12FC|nr:lipid IV(A) 3-deoxy-D-manno-octulosonic acid transferase [Pseudidiomarina mangrovi]
MTLSYRVLIALLTPLIFIYLWVRGARAPEYRKRWSERLALQTVPVQARDGIVIHCVSVGETVAARGLIEDILRSYPQLPVTLTAMTPTAAELAQKLFADRVYHYYLPIDTRGAMARFIEKFAPRCVLILETELWPNLLAEAKRHGAQVMLVNARLSAKSLRSYQRFSWLLGPIWSALDLVICQHVDSERRFQQLGVARERTVVRGNLKFDCQVPAATTRAAKQWRTELARPILVAASTHQGEDAIILDAFARLIQAVPELLLIIVPRHPERFREVTSAAQQRFSTLTRSSGQTVSASDQVLIGDTMGELLFWYAAADIAFVGGSLIPRGGHNPLEPIATKTPIISGRHVFNFQPLFDRLTDVNGVRLVDDAEQLAEQCLQLLQQPVQGQTMAAVASEEFAAEHGATARVLADIQGLFPPPNGQARTLKMILTSNPNAATEIWFDDNLATAVSDDYFAPSFWRQKGQIIGSATGRASAWFIQHQPQNMLLRHYYRGGLVGKFNRDRFAREAIVKSRAMAEFSLLLQLRELGLPVPQPIAARYQRAPIWGYRADILVAVIADSQDVFKLLLQRSLTAAEWQSVGATIRQLHQAGVYHSDLNCHNIMLDQAGKVWLVDFDKCGFRTEGEWQQANLQRLLRSLLKEQGKAEQSQQLFHWQQTTDWPHLLQGYEQA